MAVERGTVPRLLLLVLQSPERRTNTVCPGEASDCVLLVYDAHGTGFWGWFAVLIRRLVDLLVRLSCAAPPFRFFDLPSSDAWLFLSPWFQKLLLIFPRCWITTVRLCCASLLLTAVR